MPRHFIFESFAYLGAFRVYSWSRERAGDFLDAKTRWNLIAAAFVGAAVGSEVIYWFEDPPRTASQWSDVHYLLAVKTIVGAILVVTAAVEFARAGIPEKQARLISGDKSRSIFDRYNIVDERDIQAAGQKLED